MKPGTAKNYGDESARTDASERDGRCWAWLRVRLRRAPRHYAVVARNRCAQTGPTLQVVATTAGPTTSTLPVAEIYTYGNGDSTLGIGPNFSCLYLFLDASGKMRASMVAVGNLGTDVRRVHHSDQPQ